MIESLEMEISSPKTLSTIEYRWNDKEYLTHEKFYQLLKQFGDLLPDPMSERVDLNEYTDKWLRYADILLAIDKGKVIGLRVLYANDLETRCAHGLLLSILPQYQGRGIGRKMYLLSIELAKSRGMTKFFLFVHYENQVAINLYKSLGFFETNRNYPKITMQLNIV
jgi:ribosomal protein S18 acetylase RimI-like enzyme